MRKSWQKMFYIFFPITHKKTPHSWTMNFIVWIISSCLCCILFSVTQSWEAHLDVSLSGYIVNLMGVVQGWLLCLGHPWGHRCLAGAWLVALVTVINLRRSGTRRSWWIGLQTCESCAVMSLLSAENRCCCSCMVCMSCVGLLGASAVKKGSCFLCIFRANLYKQNIYPMLSDITMILFTSPALWWLAFMNIRTL